MKRLTYMFEKKLKEVNEIRKALEWVVKVQYKWDLEKVLKFCEKEKIKYGFYGGAGNELFYASFKDVKDLIENIELVDDEDLIKIVDFIDTLNKKGEK